MAYLVAISFPQYNYVCLHVSMCHLTFCFLKGQGNRKEVGRISKERTQVSHSSQGSRSTLQ